MYMTAHGDRRGCDAGAGHELYLHRRVQTLRRVAGFGEGGGDRAGGSRRATRAGVADDQVIPEDTTARDPHPDQAHGYRPGLNPSTRPRSIVMYVPAVTMYSASRPRMAPSPAGHSTPRP